MKVFTLKSVSKYGTAYYISEGFKQAVAFPSALFTGGVAPKTLDIEIGVVEGEEATASFAEKAVKVQATGIAKALKTLTPEQKKAVREAGRKAERDALAAQGVSL